MPSEYNIKNISSGIVRAVLILVGIFVGLYILYLIQSLVLYLFLSVVVFLICHPIKLKLIKRLRFSNTLASVTSLVFLFIGVGFLSSLLVPFIAKQSTHLNQINFDKIGNYLSESFNGIQMFLGKNNLQSSFKELNFFDNLEISYITDFLNSFINFIQSFGLGLLSIAFISFFLIKDHKQIYGQLISFIKDKVLVDKINLSVYQIKHSLGRYFIGIFFQACAIFVLNSLSLSIVGTQDTFSIASIASIFHVIPYIGPVISLVVMLLFSSIEIIPLEFNMLFLPMTYKILIGFSITLLIDNFFIQTLIFSKTLKLHPLEVFLTILASGFIFGIAGIILAIPIYTILKVVVREFLFSKQIGLSKNADNFKH